MIGFTEPEYSVSEPGSGSVTVRVCVEVVSGVLGQQVRIVPRFMDDTAIRKYAVYVHVRGLRKPSFISCNSFKTNVQN